MVNLPNERKIKHGTNRDIHTMKVIAAWQDSASIGKLLEASTSYAETSKGIHGFVLSSLRSWSLAVLSEQDRKRRHACGLLGRLLTFLSRFLSPSSGEATDVRDDRRQRRR